MAGKINKYKFKYPIDSNAFLWEKLKYREKYSAIRKTTYCRECGKEVTHVFKPQELLDVITGLISSDELSFRIKDEDIFLHVFYICVDCNGGYDIDGIEIKPSYDED